MKSIWSIVAVVLIAQTFGCSKPVMIPTVMHHVEIPSTNHYRIVDDVRVRPQYVSHGPHSASVPPAVLVEHSRDGTNFVLFAAAGVVPATSTHGARAKRYRDVPFQHTDLWIRVTTTNQADVGKQMTLVFYHVHANKGLKASIARALHP